MHIVEYFCAAIDADLGQGARGDQRGRRRFLRRRAFKRDIEARMLRLM